MRACLNLATVDTTPVETAVAVSRESGFDAIELPFDKAERMMREGSVGKVGRLANDLGLEVASVGGPRGFDFSEEEDFEKTLDVSDRLVDAALSLGCDLIMLAPSRLGEQVPASLAVAQVASRIGRLASRCDPRMRWGLEFIALKGSTIGSLDLALKVIESVGSPKVGLVPDSFHLHLGKTNLTDLSRVDPARIFIVHVNDSETGSADNLTAANRLLPGLGVIDLAGLRKSLEASGYDGYLSLEIMRPEYWRMDAKDVAIKGRESLRALFGI